MRVLFDLLQRPPAVMRQLVQWGLIGAFNTVLCFGMIFVCMRYLGFSALLANLAAYIIAVTSAYILNSRYTFRSANAHPNAVMRFFAASLTGYVLNALTLTILLRLYPGAVVISQICAMLVYSLTFFFLSRRWVFAGS